MGRIGVISDIHANAHAFRAVLAMLDTWAVDDIVCLGDVVGYGPAPGECIDLVFDHCRHTVMGNHDHAIIDPQAAADFNGNARSAIMWTKRELHTRHVDMISMLPRVAYVERDVMCVHDCPVPCPTDYVHDQRVAALAFRGIDTHICLLGHTHVPAVFEAPTDRVEDEYGPTDIAAYSLADGQGVRLKPGRRYICNPGAVGQPRDNDPRASFGILDLDEALFSVHRVEYDIDAAQQATHEAGLPPILAERLAIGA